MAENGSNPKPAVAAALQNCRETHRPSVSAARLEAESVTPSFVLGQNDPVCEILTGLNSFGFRAYVGGCNFRTVVSTLSETVVDGVLESLNIQNPDVAVAFFYLLRNKYGFRHSGFSQLAVSHILAGKGRFKELHCVIKQLVEEQGSGSASSFCDLLLNKFRNWDSNGVVWDMLAFAYSRHEMIHDALFVIAKMKDLNLQASVPTYNSLLHNLRHTDVMWDICNEIKASGAPQSEYTTSILIHGLCAQSKLQDAISFLQDSNEVVGPSIVSINTVMSKFCKVGLVDVARFHG
ncbi:putative pentatricopeptide repeat-containing protein, partial [Cucurbita argyrosperma subsp. sororia]